MFFESKIGSAFLQDLGWADPILVFESIPCSTIMPRISHREWMQLALDQARAAGEASEVPVGAVIVDAQDRLITVAANRRERDHDPTAHAEMVALRQAGAIQQDWQLRHCRLYVTLEPCPMCAAAIAQARIALVIYGADDPKAGGVRSVLNLFDSPGIFHHPQVIGGIREAECREILTQWFEHHRLGKPL